MGGYPPEKNAAYLAARYASQRERFFQHLGGKKCAACGTDDPDAGYQFDHIDPSSKSFPVGRLWSTKDLPRALEELSKCQVLCAACHTSKTATERRGVERGFTHGRLYGWMKKKCQCHACQTHKREWHDQRNAKRRAAAARGSR